MASDDEMRRELLVPSRKGETAIYQRLKQLRHRSGKCAYLISLMTPVLASDGRSAFRPYLRGGVRVAPPLGDDGSTYRVFIIFAPISINFTVSTNAELMYVGCDLSWTSRSVTVSGVQTRASSCSSTVGIGVLCDVSVSVALGRPEPHTYAREY